MARRSRTRRDRRHGESVADRLARTPAGRYESRLPRACERGESRLAEWFVYQHEEKHLGPLTTEALVEAIFSGTIRSDVWIAAPGGSKWTRALEVPVVARLLDGLPTRRHRESGMRIVPGSNPTPLVSDMRATVPDAPPTERTDPVRTPDGFPVPPPSSSPMPPTLKRRAETQESPRVDLPKRRTQGM